MGGVSVEEVAKNPDRYLGKRVTISGEVERILGPRAFTIGGGGFLFDREMTVISRMDIVPVEGRTAARPLRPRDIVQVEGTVEQAPMLEIRRRVGWDLDPEIKIELEDVKPVVIADKIITSARSGNQTTSGDDNQDTRTGARNQSRPQRL